MERLVNRANYLLVNEFLLFLNEVKQVSPASAERYRFYLRHLLLWAMDTLLSKAHTIRPGFPAYIASLQSPRGGPLVAESQKKIIEITRQFFEWARIYHSSDYRGISAAWIEMLRPTRQKQDITPEEHVFVTVEEAIQLASAHGEEGDLAHWRDRAAAARLFLSGERANAFVTSPIGAIDFDESWVHQWTDLGVRTKNSKRSTTFLLPIPELIEVARSWDTFVRKNLPISSPWYAPIDNKWGEQALSFEEAGEARNHALDRRLRILFEKAGLPYRSAHKFRHGHAVYGLLHARTMADYKAVSMNLMHNDLQITDSIYAPMLSKDVRLRIANLAVQPVNQQDDDLRAMVSRLSNADLSKVMLIVAERLAA